MKVCKGCGCTYEKIVETQKIGCPECYFEFKDEFKDVLEGLGVKSKYKGTLPMHISGYRSILVDKMVLQQKLEEAVNNEEFEKAALYRDYLQALENGRKNFTEG